LILTGSIGSQHRFIETFDLFFQAVTQQAYDRKSNTIPDIESYILLRRDTSGCKPCFALIEYANNLDIPDEVMEHPAIRALNDAANDHISWSNDVYSYNGEQANGCTLHNFVTVAMKQNGIDLQSAIDYVGDLCNQTLHRFNEDRKTLPSWGPDIDRQVAIYVDGLASWISTCLWWSVFASPGLLQPADLATGVSRLNDIQASHLAISRHLLRLPYFHRVGPDSGGAISTRRSWLVPPLFRSPFSSNAQMRVLFFFRD